MNRKMSDRSQDSRSPGPVPPRWLHCPRKAAELVANKFLAFKTPLSSDYDGQVPEECRFGPSMIFTSMNSYKRFALSDGDFKSKYRFSKEYARLIANFVEEYLHKDTRGAALTSELQVLVALRTWARNEALQLVKKLTFLAHDESVSSSVKWRQNIFPVSAATHLRYKIIQAEENNYPNETCGKGQFTTPSSRSDYDTKPTF
ncbi:hypothetical protein C0J52_12859 [Blattella germanica]|nr:hypothetical protein C0J52_12859 [Blattella germanica]